MYLTILTSTTTPIAYKQLDLKLNELIQQTQCYLFTILVHSKVKELELGAIWAKNNGAPTCYIQETKQAKIFEKILFKSDYIIFLFDKQDVVIKQLFMKYKMMNKHGTVIQL